MNNTEESLKLQLSEMQRVIDAHVALEADLRDRISKIENRHLEIRRGLQCSKCCQADLIVHSSGVMDDYYLIHTCTKCTRRTTPIGKTAEALMDLLRMLE